VKEAIEWCKRGPPLASVEMVEVRYERPTGEFRGFRILR
jgi:acylphosphatase